MEDKKQIWKDYKKEIFEKLTDFSDLFSNLKKQKSSGNGWVSACCPFHDDHNPSFAYNRQTGKWACFAKCGKGNALDFIVQTTGSPFKDVLFSLGDKAGVPRPNRNGEKPNRIDEDTIRQLAAALWSNKSALNYFKEKRGFTEETIRKYQLGWDRTRGRFAIPIRNDKGDPVNIRFNSPVKEQKMQNLKGFGNTPRLYGADDLAKYQGKQVILCEGEFDRLLLQQNGFMAVTSTHGCRSFNKQWVPLFNGKEVVIIYDCDPEGQGAVEGVVLRALKGTEVASIKNIRLPLEGSKTDKDVTDYLAKPRFMGGNLLDKRTFSAEDLKKLIEETPPLDKNAPSPGNGKETDILPVVNAIRNSDSMKTHERQVAISETIANYLSEKGAFFFDSKASLEFLCLNGQIFTIGNNRPFNSLMQKIGESNVTTAEGRFVWEFIRNRARISGSEIKSVGWIYGDPAKPAIYVHTHNEKGEILKIAPKSVQLMANGHNEDQIMLAPSDRVSPIRYLENADFSKGWELFKRFLHDGFPCGLADRALLSMVALLIFLKDFISAKPLIRLSGSTDSGKTTAGKLIGYLIYGEDIAKTGTIASFYTDGSKNPLAMLDNLEVSNIKGELLDFLLTGATGIVHEKKKLYTDQEIVRERAIAFLLTTGIESLGKPELLSRQWEIACDKSHHDPNFRQPQCFQDIQKNRDLILSAIFNLLAFEILPNLSKGGEIELFLKQKFKSHPKERTFGCLSLVLLIWDIVEERLGLNEDLWIEWINSQKAESEETSTETNIVLQFLNLFKGTIHAFQMSSQDKTKGEFFEKYLLLPKEEAGEVFFEATARLLLHVFTALAKQYGYPRPFENAKQLMARLNEALPVIQASGWRVDLKVRTARGDRIHRLRLPRDGED